MAPCVHRHAGRRGVVNRVHLNVDGSVYTTSLETLTDGFPGSFLHSMFSRNYLHIQKDERERVFIDRDGSRFAAVLNFLRSGCVHTGDDSVSRVIGRGRLLWSEGHAQHARRGVGDDAGGGDGEADLPGPKQQESQQKGDALLSGANSTPAQILTPPPAVRPAGVITPGPCVSPSHFEPDAEFNCPRR